MAAENHKRNTKNPYFGDLKPFNVIDVDIPKKLVASACMISSMSVPAAIVFTLDELVGLSE